MILCKLRLTVWAASIASAALPGIPRDTGTALKAVRGGEKVADAVKTVDEVGDANRIVGTYSNIPNPRNAGPGINVTRSQKEKILEQIGKIMVGY